MNHCSRFGRVPLVVVMVLLAANSASAQATETTETTSVAEAKVEFEQRFAEYQDSIRAIEELRTDYQSAGVSGRKTINHQLVEKLKIAKGQLDAMVAAAVEAYRLGPQDNPQLAELLLAVAKHYAAGDESPPKSGNFGGGDNYEKALPIIELLLANGSKDKRLPAWGFLAAFATNDYDLAEKYLEQAKTSGSFADPSTVTDPVDKAILGNVMQYAAVIPEYRKLWAQEQATRAVEAKADDLPRVRLSTTKGDIVIELFENEAPQAVANFLTLTKSGFYDDVSFHRVLPVFMAQGGDPEGTGSGGPGYSIRCECYEPNARHHFRGSLSMAHAGRDTGGSQFFLTFVPTTHLDGKHTVFGRVIEGIEVLGELQKRDPQASNPPQPDRIIKAEVVRDRGHEYNFEKLPAR
jgi:cyclophilin family peptidyl-prolyl cis-trans isomerase